MNTNTTIRLIAIPFASARPRSGPIRNRIRQRARKPITVVRPLEKIEPVELHKAFTIASWGSPSCLRYSSKLWIRKTE